MSEFASVGGNANIPVKAGKAAKLMGICRATFYEALKSPRFPQGTRIGRTRLWLPSDLHGWLRANVGKELKIGDKR
jgi:predicted DNA-binding transcriptional regulator AlpA